MDCPLCDRPTTRHQSGGLDIFNCTTCGQFAIDLGGPATNALIKDDKLRAKRYLLSAVTKGAATPITIDYPLLVRLERGAPSEKTVTEKIELMVGWFAQRSSRIGDMMRPAPETDYPAAWCRSPDEWTALFHEVVGLEYLTLDNQRTKVTLKGWQWLGEKPKAAGHDAFIAMWFDDKLTPVKDAIQRAIEAAGYRALRVDEDDYTGGVVDRVLAQIRRSRFVVSDFTGNRGGVYYEAGFAAGLGIPVIHTCHEDCLDLKNEATRMHFDVAHVTAISWKHGALPVFEKRLTEHVEALFGRGPRSLEPPR